MKTRGSNKLLAIRARARREGWLDKIRGEGDERAAIAGCWYDPARAAHAVEWGPRYLILQGAYQGKPFELADWARERIVEPLFGWVRRDEDWGRIVRRHRYVFAGVAKKNGKSPIGAYVATYCLAGDGPNTLGCEGYVASTDKNQAAIVHGACCSMVEASPALSAVLHVRRSRHEIGWRRRGSWLRVLSSSPKRNEGWNAQFIIADELHKWHGRELWDALRWAFASRPEPVLFVITTAGSDEESVCHEQWQKARRVASGAETDQQMLPVIFEAEEGDNPASEATWRKANPALGLYLPLGQFRHDYEEARKSKPALRRWKQLRLNVWPSGAGGWLEKEDWRKCRQVVAIPDQTPCSLGLDLGLTSDLSAVVAAFPEELEATSGAEDGDPSEWDNLAVDLRCHAWIPRAVVESEEDKDTAPWLEWSEAGWLTITEGSQTDFGSILAWLGQFAEAHPVLGLRYDPMFAAYLCQQAELRYGIPRVEFPQTMLNFAQPSRLWERFCLRRQLRHDGNELLAWCATHCGVKCDDNDNFRPIKPKRGGKLRVDAAVAGIMALAGALEQPARRIPRHYDRNEPRFTGGRH